MAKSFKYKDDNYLDSTGIVHNKELLSTKIINSSGSNDNGEYIKFEDGNMLCRGKATVSANSNSGTWTFPMEFVDNDIDYSLTSRYVGGQGASARLINCVSNITSTQLSFYNMMPDSTVPAYSRTVSIIVYGRWK